MPAEKRKKRRRRPNNEPLPGQMEFWADEDTSDWTEPATRVRKHYKAVRLRISRRLTVNRQADTPQTEQVQEMFTAEEKSFTLSKRVYDTREPAVKRINEVLTAIMNLFASPDITMAYPGETGTRLIREDAILDFDERLKALVKEMQRATVAFHRLMTDAATRQEFLARQAERLGAFYDEEDYGFEYSDMYQVLWDFPSVEVPSYLSRLDPKLYAEHEKMLQARFESAVRRRERDMAEGLLDMTDRLIERLSGIDDNGKPKAFRDTTIKKVFEAIDAADQQLNEFGIGQGELAGVFSQLKRAVKGMSPDTAAGVLRSGDDPFRQKFTNRLTAVREAVTALSVLKPRRRLLRTLAKAEETETETEA